MWDEIGVHELKSRSDSTPQPTSEESTLTSCMDQEKKFPGGKPQSLRCLRFAVSPEALQCHWTILVLHDSMLSVLGRRFGGTIDGGGPIRGCLLHLFQVPTNVFSIVAVGLA